MKHVMLDLETFGTHVGSVIASIGACEFDSLGIGHQFYRIVDVGTCLLGGLTVDDETIKWWMAQSSEAKQSLLTIQGKVSIQQALREFSKFIDHNTQLWAKGPDYDCVLLAEAYRRFNMAVPWQFRNTRDVRTIMALSQIKAVEHGTKHNACDDAIAQAETVRLAYKKLGLELKGE